MAGALALALAMGAPCLARGDASGASATPAAPQAPAAPSGLAVLGRAGAEGAAWALAKEIYARPSLRPAALDETRARVLVGDPAASDAPRAIKDLADERAGIRGDDGASRALLRSIASQLGVRAVVVVEQSASGEPSASVFLAESGAFDAARYPAEPAPAVPAAATIADGGAPAASPAASDGGMAASPPAQSPAPPPPPAPRWSWSGTAASLDRAYGAPAAPVAAPETTHAPALATSAIPPAKPKEGESHPFYASPWFWGAVGAAVFGGTAVYFATRDNTTGTIHLEAQVPK